MEGPLEGRFVGPLALRGSPRCRGQEGGRLRSGEQAAWGSVRVDLRFGNAENARKTRCFHVFGRISAFFLERFPLDTCRACWTRSRSKFYIGMHNEMVGDRAPGAALFVCFKAAEKGGEFLVADGRKMFKRLDQAQSKAIL